MTKNKPHGESNVLNGIRNRNHRATAHARFDDYSQWDLRGRLSCHLDWMPLTHCHRPLLQAATILNTLMITIQQAPLSLISLIYWTPVSFLSLKMTRCLRRDKAFKKDLFLIKVRSETVKWILVKESIPNVSQLAEVVTDQSYVTKPWRLVPSWAIC